METVRDFIFSGSQITADGDSSYEIKRRLLLQRKAMVNLDSILKNKDITLLTKVCRVKAMVFPVVTYGCESWTVKKAERWRIDAFELWCWGTVESPLDCKGIQLVHPRGGQSWVFIGRTDAEAEAPILWPPDAKNWENGKDPDAGKEWRWEEEGMTEDETVGCNHQLHGHKSEEALGVGDGQGGLACCSPWDRKELDTTMWLNLNTFIWIKNIYLFYYYLLGCLGSQFDHTGSFSVVRGLSRCGAWALWYVGSVVNGHPGLVAPQHEKS